MNFWLDVHYRFTVLLLIYSAIFVYFFDFACCNIVCCCSDFCVAGLRYSFDFYWRSCFLCILNLNNYDCVTISVVAFQVHLLRSLQLNLTEFIHWTKIFNPSNKSLNLGDFFVALIKYPSTGCATNAKNITLYSRNGIRYNGCFVS